MKPMTQFSLSTLAGCTLLLMVIEVGCGNSAEPSTEGTGGATSGGGTTGSGGAVVGAGGEVGTGGSSRATTAGGGRGSGGRMAGGTGGSSVVSSGSGGSGTGGDSGCVPDYSCTPVSPDTGDPYADCVTRVNQFRACVCLPPLAQWTAGQACADQDAQYDSTQGTAHAGAQANICDWGNAQDECPDWTRSTPAAVIDRCLLMMFQEGPPPAGSCTGSCYTAHGHYINMTGTNYRNGVACGFYTTSSGSIWATQNFK